jgi:hypothetical protein
MASTKRGPGAGNTEASGKTTPLKSNTHNSRASHGGQIRKRKPTENYAGARRAYAVYDGRTWLGALIWNETTQQALAWDASRRFVGRFSSIKAAADTITKAAELHVAEARRRLADLNAPFVTGLPEHFLRPGR